MKKQFAVNAKAVLLTSLLILLAAFATLASAQNTQPLSEPDHEVQVRAFVDAFNLRDIDGMLGLATDSIQWLIVDGPKISMETSGKDDLRKSMEGYFKSCPSCKSALEWVQVAGHRVTAMERAMWAGKNGDKAQRSLSVYEFKEGKISRVYYFSAEDATPPPQR